MPCFDTHSSWQHFSHCPSAASRISIHSCLNLQQCCPAFMLYDTVTSHMKRPCELSSERTGLARLEYVDLVHHTPTHFRPLQQDLCRHQATAPGPGHQ